MDRDQDRETNRNVEGRVDQTSVDLVFGRELGDESIADETTEKVVREETFGEVGSL